MDAAKKFYKNTGILLAAVLVLAVPGWSQTPSFALGSTNVSLNQSVTSASVPVTSSITGTPITYSVAISGLSNNGGNGVWLRLFTPATQTTPDSVGVQLNNVSGMVAGTYTATVTLTASAPAGVTPASFTVSWTNGSGGGTVGGGGANTIAVSKTTSLLSAASGGVTFDNITVSTSNSTGVGLSIASSTTSCGDWLTAGLNTTTIAGASTANINITANAFNLSNVSCVGKVTITPNPGTAIDITVNFTVGTGSGGGSGNGGLSIAPSSFTLNYNTGGSFPSQTLTLTNSSGATLVTATSNVTWLLINGVSTTNFTPGTALQASLSSAATGLASGQYTGTINFTDNLNNTGSVTATLSVNGGTSTGLTISPTSLTFNTSVGGGAQSNSVSVVSNTGGNFSVSTTANWLSATVSTSSLASNTTGTATITVSPGSLPNGTYSGNITITVGGQQQAISVTMVVGTGSGGSGGATGVAPNAVSLNYQLGTDASFVNRPDIVITGPAGSWSSSISSGASWLSLNPSSGSSLPVQATIVANPTGLSAGGYSGTITITTPGGTQNVTVSLAVSSGAILSSRPSDVIFNYHSGDAAPAGQSVFFSSSDIALNAALDITGTVTTSGSWISVTTFQKSIQVFVDPRGLSGGLYSGSVTVSPSGLGSVTVPVVLVIDNGTGGGGSNGPLIFSPTTMAFSTPVGSSPFAQTLSLTSTSSTSFSVTSNQTWLSVSPGSGTAPTNISVSVNSSSLPAGTYNGALTFNSSGITQTLPVSLTVTGSGGGGGGNSGNVKATPTSLSFSGQAPTGVLAVQAIQVDSTSGVAGVGFTSSVSTTSGGNWLSTSPSAGSQSLTSTTVSVTVNATGLAAGTYQGNVRLTPTGGTAVDVPVTLTLTAPPTVSATPTNLTFTFRAGGATPAAQSIAVSGAGAALAFTATAASTGNWLQVSPAAGTTGASPTSISASVNPASLGAGTYQGTITVAGSGGATGSTTVNVTLTVTVPLPTITKVTNAASYSAANIAPGEIITIFGTDMGPATAVGLALDTSGKVATTLGGVQVTVKGYPAPLIYVSNTQISAVVPYEVALFTSADVLVKYLSQSSNGISVNVSTTAPGLFTANSSGTGPGAILNQNGSVNSPSNPANRNDTVVVYLTGEGQTSPAGVTGKVTTVSSTPPLTPAPLLQVSILVGGQPANFSFAGEAPGFVSGVMQLNVTIPAAAAPGQQPIVVSIGGNPSQTGVTVSVQ